MINFAVNFVNFHAASKNTRKLLCLANAHKYHKAIQYHILKVF